MSRNDDTPAISPAASAEWLRLATGLAEAAERSDDLAFAYYARELESARGSAERAWVDPPPAVGAGQGLWFLAAVRHRLGMGDDPGPRPFLETEWPAFVERWRRSLHFYARAVRLNDPCAPWHLRALADTHQAALSAEHGALVERHFLPLIWAEGKGVCRRAWAEEAGYMLEHGTASGRYRPPPPGPLFPLRSDAERAADEERRRPSTIILRQSWNGYPHDTELSPPADVAWSLVENGIADWFDGTRAPYDPRPPVEATPAADWVSLRFLIPSRLASRHTVAAGVTRPVPPAEAASLVERGLAEVWMPPPPPPPPPTVFE